MSEERCISCGHLRSVHPGPDAHGCDANMCECPGYVPAEQGPAEQKRQPQRDALWHAIYAAEFVREFRWAYLNVPASEAGSYEQQIAEAASRAKKLADHHHEVVPKEER